MKWLFRAARVLVGPREAFRLIVADQHEAEPGRVGDVLLLMFFVMLGTMPLPVALSVMSYEQGLAVVLGNIVSLYLSFCLMPVVGCMALGLFLAGWYRVKHGWIAVDRILIASLFLWIPVGILGLLGATLQSLNINVIFLPHVPLAYLAKIEAAWWKIVVHLLVSYGWSMYLLRVLYQVIGQEPSKSKPTKTKMAGLFLIGMIGVSYLFGLIFVHANYDDIRPVQVGDPASSFSLPRVGSQQSFTFDDDNEKIMVVKFWATWCPQCVEQMPALEKFAQAHPGVSIVAIHQGDSVEAVSRYVAKQKWQHVVYLVDSNLVVTRAYRVDSLPTYFIISEDEKIVAKHVGHVSEDWLNDKNVLKR
jgi:thiol-disulfide isomerase/thioredoxin